MATKLESCWNQTALIDGSRDGRIEPWNGQGLTLSLIDGFETDECRLDVNGLDEVLRRLGSMTVEANELGDLIEMKRDKYMAEIAHLR